MKASKSKPPAAPSRTGATVIEYTRSFRMPSGSFMETDTPGTVLVDGAPVVCAPYWCAKVRLPGFKYANGHPVYAEGWVEVPKDREPPSVGSTVTITLRSWDNPRTWELV